MVSAWTCDSFSWFQSAIVFTKNEFLNCSVWAVGTIKHLVLLVVSCWTKFEDTWSGKCLGLMCLLFVFWGRKNVSVGRAGMDPLTVLNMNFSLWSRRLLSNVSRLRLVSMVVTKPWVSRAVVSSDEASCTVLDLF